MRSLTLLTLSLLLGITGCAGSGTRTHLKKTSREALVSQIHLSEPAPLRAGVVKVEITPPVGTPLAGYSKRKGQPSEGIRDPLYARVLVLSDGEDQWVLVSADLLIFPPPLAEAILKRAREELGIPRRAIVLAATHTHSGSGAIAPGPLYKMVFGRYNKEIQEGLQSRVLWGIRQALENQEPVRWGMGIAEKGLAGLVENRSSKTGFVNSDLGLFLLESQDGRPFALVVGASAHPTLLDSQDLRLSADFPGQMTQDLETAYPEATVLFINGPAGDLRPIDQIGTTPDERVERFGHSLSELAQGMVSQIELSAYGDLAAWGRWVRLPPVQMRLGKIPIHPWLGRWIRPQRLMFLNQLALNEIVFAALPAELTSEVGGKIQQALKAQEMKVIPVGFANGYLGYAVSPRQYRSGSYEAWMTWYGPNFGETMAEEIIRSAVWYRDLLREDEEL